MISIDATYFAYEPTKITGISSTNDVNLTELNRAIKRFTKQYLKKLLGDEVYEEYITESADEESTKWKPLEDVLADTADKVSPIANYVYYFYRGENSLQHGSMGDFTDKKDNMQLISPIYKMVMAWNEGVALNEVVCNWIVDNIINAETPAIAIAGTINVEGWFCKNEGLLKRKSTLAELMGI